MAETRYFFRKENRVLRRADFLATYDKGKSYRRKCAHVFIQKREPDTLPTRLGITATRKTGGAVQRNRLKRFAREIFRLALPGLKNGFTLIVNFHQAAVEMDYSQVESELHSVWQQAGLFKDDARATY